FDPVKLPADRRKELEKLVPRLRENYRADPDPGIHSAVDWLLRRWGQEAALKQIDQEMADQPPNQRRWYVTKQHHTLAVFKPDKEDDEKLHHGRIPRSFTLATKEVTVRQFEEFLQANPSLAAGFRKRVEEKYSPDP